MKRGKGAAQAALQWEKVDVEDFALGPAPPAFKGDAGYDMYTSRVVTIPAGGMAAIPTNVKIALPSGTWGMLVGRSSSFMKRLLLVQTAIIDNGFRGELFAMVKNLNDKPVTIQKKERLFQLILMPLITPETVEGITSQVTPRGTKGFGSTGIEEVA